MVLTSFVDGDSPETYVGISRMYCKSISSASNLREITNEEHRAYMKDKEDYIPPVDTPDEQ